MSGTPVHPAAASTGFEHETPSKWAVWRRRSGEREKQTKKERKNKEREKEREKKKEREREKERTKERVSEVFYFSSSLRGQGDFTPPPTYLPVFPTKVHSNPPESKLANHNRTKIAGKTQNGWVSRR